jgi:hypothetical protein
MPTDSDFLKEQILAEHSKAQTMRVVRWVGHDAERLAVLMEIFMGNEYRLTQRSAWAVRYVGENAPELIAPWLPKIAARLRQPGIHDAVKRNALNIFEPLEIPDNLQDELADLCFGYLADPKEALAIRCASMTILEKICRKIPELKPELRLLIEEYYEGGTAGFKSRAKKILKMISSG